MKTPIIIFTICSSISRASVYGTLLSGKTPDTEINGGTGYSINDLNLFNGMTKNSDVLAVSHDYAGSGKIEFYEYTPGTGKYDNLVHTHATTSSAGKGGI